MTDHFSDDHGFPCEWCGSSQRMMRFKGFQRPLPDLDDLSDRDEPMKRIIVRKKRANHWRCIITRGVVNGYWKFR